MKKITKLSFRQRILDGLIGATIAFAICFLFWCIVQWGNWPYTVLANTGFFGSLGSGKTWLVILLRLLASLICFSLIFVTEKKYACIAIGVTTCACFFNFFDLFIPKYFPVDGGWSDEKEKVYWAVLDYIQIGNMVWNIPDFLILGGLPLSVLLVFL